MVGVVVVNCYTHRAALVKDEELDMIRRFDCKVTRLQTDLLDSNGMQYTRLLLNLLTKLSKDDTVQYDIQYYNTS